MPALDTHPELFTPTQRKILAVLADGMPHCAEDFRGCQWDEHAVLTDCVRVQVQLLRKKLNPLGEHVSLELIKNKTHYRLVRLLASAVNGYR